MYLNESVRRAGRSTASLLTAGFAVLLVLALAACGPMSSDPSASPQSAATSAAEPVTTDPAATDPADAGSTPAPAPPGPIVPAPGAGATPAADGPVEAAPLPSTAASLGEQVAFDTGIVVEIASVEPISVEAGTPGEVSGPALVVNVTARNDSSQPQSVDSAVVTVVGADGDVGIGTTAGGPSPLAGVIGPGQTASGRYVFMLDPAAGREVTVSVNYAAGEPVAVFTGTSS